MKIIPRISLCMLVVALMSISFVSCGIKNVVDNSIDITFEEALSDLENKVSEKYSLEEFTLSGIMVDTIDSPDHEDSMIIVSGTYIKDGKTTTWGESYEISYDDFQSLYKINDNYVVYNTVETQFDEIVTDVPGWAIKSVSNIITQE